MRESRRLEQRLSDYRRSLQKSPAHERAFYRSFLKYQNSNLQTKLYLHVFAPVMTAYAEWVLREAEASGKKRLYFLARDGWQMYLAAEKLAKARGIGIDLRYLRISRYALRIPSFHMMGLECLNQICLDGMEVTFETIVRRAALTEEEADAMAAMLGFEDRREENLTRREIFALKEQLSHTPLFMECVYAHSRDAYEETMQYLAGEGLLEDIPYALVDSGWTGTIQQTLELLLSGKKQKADLEGYYFGLYELPKGAREGYHAFYFAPENGLKRKVFFSNCLFESVFSEPEGMTVGYVRKGKRVVPVEKTGQNPNGTRLLQNAAALQAYVGAYCEEITWHKMPYRNENALVQSLLVRFMGNPVREEADCYGAYLFSDDVREEHLKCVGAALSKEELRSQNFIRRFAAKLGIIKEKTAERGWIEGSIAAGGRGVRRYLRHVRCYKFFVYLRKTWKGLFL